MKHLGSTLCAVIVVGLAACGQPMKTSELHAAQSDYSQSKGTLQYMSTKNASAGYILRTKGNNATLFVDAGIVDHVEHMHRASIEPAIRCLCTVYAGRDYVAIVESNTSIGKAKVWYRAEYPGTVLD